MYVHFSLTCRIGRGSSHVERRIRVFQAVTLSQSRRRLEQMLSIEIVGAAEHDDGTKEWARPIGMRSKYKAARRWTSQCPTRHPQTSREQDSPSFSSIHMMKTGFLASIVLVIFAQSSVAAPAAKVNLNELS